MNRYLLFVLYLGFAFVFTACATTQTNDPLPSWNEDASKQAIRQFVNDLTAVGGSRFVPPAQRIAVFDNNGTHTSG